MNELRISKPMLILAEIVCVLGDVERSEER